MAGPPAGNFRNPTNPQPDVAQFRNFPRVSLQRAMRIIGHLPSEANATTFGDFLSVEGIENEIEPEKEGWAIWVRSEDEWPRAQEMLTTFLADPRDPRFSGKTERARELRQKAAADAEAVHAICEGKLAVDAALAALLARPFKAED